jgi:hypothetical protein
VAEPIAVNQPVRMPSHTRGSLDTGMSRGVACFGGCRKLRRVRRRCLVADLIRVTMAVDLEVDDPQAMRDAAFERLRKAWTAEDDFPYSSASELSTDQVVNSLLADALPLEFPGCRRGRLEVESKGEMAEAGGGDESRSDDEQDDQSIDQPDRSDSDDADERDDDASEGSDET